MLYSINKIEEMRQSNKVLNQLIAQSLGGQRERSSATLPKPFPLIPMLVELEDEFNGQLHVERLAGS